ncbi:hypothetical protein L3V79_05025 [Thiotrichales bacterium 19S9-12]|nr:hypothetical protein [Thiotrichales bacterium 19S9-11]MCF6811720.1 hypothetical protein [Thiotrichales bacterium 19S9-12]
MPVTASANALYYLYILNKTDAPISFEASDKTCISGSGPYWQGFGENKNIIYPNESAEIVTYWQDNNWWLCANQKKSMKFTVNSLIDNGKKIEGKDYSLVFEWDHKNTTSGSGTLNWKTKISTDPDYAGNKAYTVFLARCSNHYSDYEDSQYCLNTYAKQKGTYEKVWVVLMNQPEV